jgi:hypothetical protein
MDPSHVRLNASFPSPGTPPASPRAALSLARTALPSANPPDDRQASAQPASPQPASRPDADMEHPNWRSAANEPSAELRFDDFLDAINPLQHIPVVSSIYRAITGDEISGPAKIVGGALFGGPLGFIAGIIDTIATQINGGEVGETALAALFGGDNDGAAPPSPVLAALQETPSPVQADLTLVNTALAAPILADTAEKTGGNAPALTGSAALQALAADLRGTGTRNTSPVALPIALPVAPADPLVAPRRGAIAQVRPSAIPAPSGFTAQMLDGLDKYRALTAASVGVPSTPGQQLDKSL